jgi:hypothetical protein
MGTVIRSVSMPSPKSPTHIRFAAVGDIHVNKDSAGTLRGLFAQAAEAADALLLCPSLRCWATMTTNRERPKRWSRR